MSNVSEPMVSVYTCVYNMADKIERALCSVKGQMYSNIEHIIVDDGSTDNVDSIIEKYIKEVNYPVKYIRKQNGGKHTALNIAWENVEGEWMINLDADDELLPNAIKTLIDAMKSIPGDVDRYWCIMGRCINQYGRLVGREYPNGINSMSEKKVKKARVVDGETIGLQRSKYLKKYRFPEPLYIKMVPEHVVWNQINSMYKTWYTNEIVRVYYVGEGDTLVSKPKTPQQFANKAYASHWDLINRKKYKCNYLKSVIKYAVSYCFASDSYKETYKYIEDENFFDVFVMKCCYLFVKPICWCYMYYTGYKK